MMNLVPTKNYPYYSYPFDCFNPVQSEVYPYRDQDNNMIVGANTSAGKTIAAELLIDSTLAKGHRVIYLSPLKALTEEKRNDWNVRYSRTSIAILTGDYIMSTETRKKLQSSRLILMTSEMMDSRTRKFYSEKNDWLKEVGLVVVDESHIMTTKRGHAVETGIMRFTLLCPHARIVLLSATMPNLDSLKKWLTSLNGKETVVINSKWRPVKLQMNYCEYPVALNERGFPDYNSNEFRKMEKAIELVMSKPDEKFLIFVHSKKMGGKIKKELRGRGIKADFHRADLGISDRRVIEKKFRDRQNGIRVLVSTSTTAWGVNLPARNVVIVGVQRGYEEVDELDIIQMAGRAGRYGIDDEGHVYLIVQESDGIIWADKFKHPRPVKSVLNDQANLVFHILGEIQAGSIRRPEDVIPWYSRSLAFRQDSKPITPEYVHDLFRKLVYMQMIRISRSVIQLTGLGQVSAKIYYHPEDVFAWYNNFQHLYRSRGKHYGDFSLAWAIANIPSNRSYITRDLKEAAKKAMNALVKSALEIDQSESESTVISIMALYGCLTKASGRNGISVKMREIRYDIERMTTALKMIDRYYAKWGNELLWKILPMRVQKGVSESRALGMLRETHAPPGYEKKKIVYPDGSRYVGQSKNQRPSGPGTYISADGNRYSGHWKDGRPHGRGSLILNDGTGFSIEL